MSEPARKRIMRPRPLPNSDTAADEPSNDEPVTVPFAGVEGSTATPPAGEPLQPPAANAGSAPGASSSHIPRWNPTPSDAITDWREEQNQAQATAVDLMAATNRATHAFLSDLLAAAQAACAQLADPRKKCVVMHTVGKVIQPLASQIIKGCDAELKIRKELKTPAHAPSRRPPRV